MNPRILLIEDNRDDEELALAALAAGGWADDVAIARDGVEALEWLFPDGERARQPLPRVVLVDIKLPRLDGLEVLGRIRQHPATRGLPVVVLSSSDSQRDVDRACELGANSYVQKPVDFERFERTVRCIASYWLEVDRLAEAGG